MGQGQLKRRRGRPHERERALGVLGREAQLAGRNEGKCGCGAGGEEEGYACPHHQSKGPACCEGSGEKTEQ